MPTNAELIASLEPLTNERTPDVIRVQALQALAIVNVAEELRLKREATG